MFSFQKLYKTNCYNKNIKLYFLKKIHMLGNFKLFGPNIIQIFIIRRLPCLNKVKEEI